jgi:hypothetical protein
VQKPSWRIRRRIVVATLLFCAGEVIYLTVWGKDTTLANTIANGIIILAASVIASYVFGATWDDRNVMAAMRGRRHRDGDDDLPLTPNSEE